jgi:hypothetical protein
LIHTSALIAAAANPAAAQPISILPFAFFMIVFGLGSLLSLAKKEVTWIDALVMIALGILVGSTFVGAWIHGGLDALGGVIAQAGT